MAYNVLRRICTARCKVSTVCYFSTTNGLQNKRLAQRGNVLHKMLNAQKTKESRPKAGNFETSSEKNTKTLLKSVPGSQGRESRRQAVLNALFMEYITDLMSSGEVSRDLIGRSIHILGVSVSQDFTILNVKWAGGDRSQDAQNQEILNRSAGRLRSELIGLNILGKVPQIQFVRDRTYSVISDIDGALGSADYGPDFVPAYRHLLEPLYVITSHSSKDDQVTDSSQQGGSTTDLHENRQVKQNSSAAGPEQVKEDQECYSDSSLESAPPKITTVRKMRMDVLGLKHDVMMKKVEESVKRSKAQHRSGGAFEEEKASVAETQPHKSFPSLDSQRFTKFLEDRKKKRLAAAKKSSRHAELLEYMVDKDGVNDDVDDSAYDSAGSDDADYFDDDKMVYEDNTFDNDEREK